MESLKNSPLLPLLIPVTIFSVLILFFVLRGSEPDLPAGIVAEPLAVTTTDSAQLLTQLHADTTNIDFANTVPVDTLTNPNLYDGAGVATGDFDGDGWVDIYLVGQFAPNKLYRNLGGLRFADVTEQAGLTAAGSGEGYGIGAHFADIDNDRDLDLFVTNWDMTNQLFRNEGDGTFREITESAGVTYAGGSTTATFADYDRDGDLDLYVATYRTTQFRYDTGKLQLQVVNGQIVIPPEYQNRLIIAEGGGIRELGEPDLFYRNDGRGRFTEISAEAGIIGRDWGLSAVFTDIDNDNWPDLYVTNDFWTPDRFYRNQGDGTFAIVDHNDFQLTAMFSMGIDFADINNDGLTDYFIADMLSRDHERRMTQHGGMEGMMDEPEDEALQLMRNTLHLNNGNGTFSDIAWLADVAASEWTWTVKFVDLDMDGLQDLLVTNGLPFDLMDSDYHELSIELGQREGRDAALNLLTEYPTLESGDLLFRNNGDLTFSDVSTEWGFTGETIGHGAALADFDNDGDFDVVINYMNQPAGVYRNDAANARLAVQLQGQRSNRQGLGARVTVTTDQGAQSKIMSTSGGYLSGHEALLVFGLGDVTEIRQLRVEWPSGHIQTFPDETISTLQPNQRYTITEPASDSEIPAPRPLANTQTQFEEVGLQAGLDGAHRESDFDDFAQQPLLPRRLSTLGPGIAWGDADADGDDDLYVAGAAGQAGTRYVNNGDGTFSSERGSFTASLEEMAPLWWHDGVQAEPQLLLSLSTVEAESPFVAQADTDWQRTGDASGGALASADFDGDGDLDLFVGGRVLPNQWPIAAPSKLFANQAGTLVDVTVTSAPDLQTIGLATGALWLDVDADADQDLLIATEWGPVRLLQNDGGQLRDVTEEAGLGESTGLWTGLTSADYDGDGDLDFAAGNLGLNTPYTASPEHPTTLFAGDLDQDGNHDLLEAYYIEDTLYPLRYRGMLAEEMLFVKLEFESYSDFAQLTLGEIFGDRLNNGQRFEATTLAHSVFFNDGAGRFRVEPLPNSVQAMPVYGITTADLDNDGFDDLYLVGNFSYADHEYMAYVGGIGHWLRGHGDGSFTLVAPNESGLSVPFDGRGLAVADYDRDGWVDIAVGINDQRPLLFHNRGNAINNSIVVALEGTARNPHAIGAMITVDTGSGTLAQRTVHAGSGYLAQDSSVLIFGLGSAETATVTVRWPDGTASEHSANAGDTLRLTLP